MSDTKTSKFTLLGMHCAACQKVIQKKLSIISDAQVHKLEQNGELELVASREITRDEVEKALEDTQYSIAA